MTLKTNKKLLTTIMSVAVILASLTTIPNAFAHPIYTGHKHFWGSTDVCYDTTALNALQIDGFTGRSSTAVIELNSARNDWNSQTSPFSFNLQTSCSHWMGSANLSGGTLALTTTSYDAGGYVYDVDTNFDSSLRSWNSGSSCNSNADVTTSLRYVATHEFGHWLVFGHATDGLASHSVMWTYYTCAATTVQPADATELDNVY